MKTPEELLKYTGDLYNEIHKDDLPPQNEREKQADIVLSRLKKLIIDIILQGVSLKTLDVALMYQWVRITTWNHGIKEKTFEHWISHLELVYSPLVKMLKELEASIKDDGPSGDMKQLGAGLDEAKNIAQKTSKKEYSQAEIVSMVSIANPELFRLTKSFIDDKIHPGLIESGYFYYWLRMSIMYANGPEKFFQKLERNWDIVMKRVNEFVVNLSAQNN